MRKKNMLRRGWILGLLSAVCMASGCAAGQVDAVFGPYESVTALEMKIGAADLQILPGKMLRVETDNPYITVEARGNRLVIQEKPHIADLEESNLTLYIPEGLTFESVEIETGAGQIRARALCCGRLDLELGAGRAEFADLTVTESADIDGGAGEIVIASGSIRNLELEMGVGEAVVTAVLTGRTELTAGVGAMDVTVLDAAAEDYTIRVAQGIGGVRIDGNVVTGSRTIGNGIQTIEIEGGIGSVQINFQSQDS